MLNISEPTIVVPLSRARKIRYLASADRDKACIHGHLDCAKTPSGVCFDELTAGLTSDDIDTVSNIVEIVNDFDEVRGLDVVLNGVRVVI